MTKLSKKDLAKLRELGVPENLGIVRQMGVLTLLDFADPGTVKRDVKKVGRRNVASYTGEFDDGVFKGVYKISILQDAISPIKVLMECQQVTRYPGFQRQLNQLNVQLFQNLKD